MIAGTRRFADCKVEWYVFPAAKGQPTDPARLVATPKIARMEARAKANVVWIVQNEVTSHFAEYRRIPIEGLPPTEGP